MSYVLWALDNELDPRHFERLCTDLLSREGYPQIVPVGGVHDRGRDAELTEANGVIAGRTFFQYSVQENWEHKLASELEKVRNNGHDITDFVYVTSRAVTGAARDRWVAQAQSTFGWRLRIFDREWLRHRLEETHRDLADRYLPRPSPVAGPPQVAAPTSRSKESGIDTPSPWLLAQQDRHADAVNAFRRMVEAEPHRADLWAGLAWSEYQLFHYDDALKHSAHALTLEPSDPQWQGIRACILTEAGISSASRASVIEGRQIFSRLARGSERWIDHYNEGNALAALNEHSAAVQAYQRALESDADQAKVWKNLASSLHQLGEHDEEIVCLDHALTLDPNNFQALVSKGVSLLLDRHDARAAVELLERARRVAPDAFRRWPYAWEWLARAYRAAGQLHTALARVREGILAVPGNPGLRNAEATILHQLWRIQHDLIPDAIRANEFLRELAPDEYGYVAELAQLHQAGGNEPTGWALLTEWLEHQEFKGVEMLRRHGAPLRLVLHAFQYLAQYTTFRTYRPVAEYLAAGSEGATSAAVRAAFLAPETERALAAALALPFGVALDAMQRAPRRRPRATLLKAMGKAKDAIEAHLPIAFIAIAEQIAATDPTQDTAIETVTQAVILAPTIALLELSRLLGWVVAVTGVPISEDDLERVGARLNYVEAQGTVVEHTLTRINDVLRLFPPD